MTIDYDGIKREIYFPSYVSDTVCTHSKHSIYPTSSRVLSSSVLWRDLFMWDTLMISVTAVNVQYVVQSRSLYKTDLIWLIPARLFVFIYLFGWLNPGMMFLLRRHISFSLIPPSVLRFVFLTFIFPIHFASVSVCHSLSAPLTSLQTHFGECTKTECTNIPLIISVRDLRSLFVNQNASFSEL